MSLDKHSENKSTRLHAQKGKEISFPCLEGKKKLSLDGVLSRFVLPQPCSAAEQGDGHHHAARCAEFSLSLGCGEQGPSHGETERRAQTPRQRSPAPLCASV